MTGWQTNLNRPCITKVMEVITSEKSTTIVWSMLGEMKHLVEKFITITIFSQKRQQSSTVEGKQVFQVKIDYEYVSHQGHYIMGSRCELAKTATTQNPESEQDKNQIDKQ